jgi:3-oxoacyl-[acyl-carrier protein] reductase
MTCGQRLTNKGIVVTGASSGIGRAIALLFARQGGRVIINYCRSQTRAEAVVQEITQAGGDATAIQADVSLVEDVDRLVNISLHRLGRIDIWVNNAGADILTGPDSRLSNREKLDKLIAVDLRGTILCCWQVAPLMKAAGGGVILNMSWDHALHGMPDPNPEMFAAVKGGVLSFSKSLARSYAPEVRVNELAPGWIETSFAKEEMQPESYQAVLETTPLRRFGTPDDVAYAALYLASDEASFITGQHLNINGGVVS